MLRYIFIFPIFALLLVSCNKEEVIPEMPVCNTNSSYQFVSSPGSWWAYEWVWVDSLGVETSHTPKDTIRILSDTIIGGHSYAVKSGSYLGGATSSIQRDSLGYIVSPNGYVYYHSNGGGDTIATESNPVFNSYSMAFLGSTTKTVPAGTFDVDVDIQSHLYSPDSTWFSPCDSVWVRHSSYVTGIGEIASQTGYVSLLQSECKYLERRLVSYYIAP